MISTTLPSVLCPNCGAAREGAFCAQCGQKAAPLNPSLREFLSELFHEISHVDGKVIRTTALLLTKPGFLSQEYFAGRRATYVSPIRLYLVLSLVYFALVAIAPPAALKVSCSSCPPEVREEVERTMRESIVHWTPRAMFVLVPVFAALIALRTRRAGRNYPSHLNFAMHVHAAWFFAATIAELGAKIPIPALRTVVGVAVLVYVPGYLALALRRAYGSTPGRAIRTAIFVFFTYMVIVLMVLAVIGFIAITTR
jgi:hypothetical protein